MKWQSLLWHVMQVSLGWSIKPDLECNYVLLICLTCLNNPCSIFLATLPPHLICRLIFVTCASIPVHLCSSRPELMCLDSRRFIGFQGIQRNRATELLERAILTGAFKYIICSGVVLSCVSISWPDKYEHCISLPCLIAFTLEVIAAITI